MKCLVRVLGCLTVFCALPASAVATDYAQVPLAVQPLMIKGNIEPNSCSTAVRLQWPVVANEDPSGYYILHYWQGGTEQKNEIGSSFFQDAPFGNEEYTWPGAEAGNHARYFGYGTAPAEGGPPRWDDCEEALDNWKAGLAGSPTYVEVPLLAAAPAPPATVDPPGSAPSPACKGAKRSLNKAKARVKRLNGRVKRLQRRSGKAAKRNLSAAKKQRRKAVTQKRKAAKRATARC